MQELRAALIRHTNTLSLLLVAMWALLLYLYILPLPFFRDDMVMLLWLKDMDWGRLWVDATGFLYYRPLSFSTLKLSELFFGYYHAPFLHLINLFFHTANSVMVALLARLMFSSQKENIAAGLAAGLLFAAYPFTYEVMPTTGPIFQLQAAFFGLAASLAYARWRNTRRRRWLYLTLLPALMGAFTCEYGVIIPIMVGLIELLLWSRGRSPDWRIPLASLTFTLVYLALWLTVPKTRSADLPLIWLHEMDLKTLYYFQGLTYPFQWLALPLERIFDPDLLTQPGSLPDRWSWTVAAIGVVTLAALVGVYVWRRRWRGLNFGLALWGTAVLPTLVTLQWDYTWNGPRLLYLPALGATALLGGGIGLLVFARPYRRIWRALGIVILVVTLTQNLLFLRGQASMLQTGGKAVDDTVATIVALPPDEPALIVNFPSWLRPLDYTYILGTEGISFLPAYSTVADLVELNGRVIRNATNITFTNVWHPWKFDQRFYTPPLDWPKLLAAVRAAGPVFLFQFDEHGAHLREAGYVQTSTDASDFIAAFGDVARLDAVESTRSGDHLHLALDWAALGPADQDWTVFVHVYGDADVPIAQGDGYPLLGLMPFWAWASGERIHDLRYIELPPDVRRVLLGIYDSTTGKRVTPVDAAGAPFPNNMVPLP